MYLNAQRLGLGALNSAWTSRRSARHILPFICLMIAGAILSSLGCDDEPQVASCTSDDDCREGFSCDLVRFVGECVQTQMVRACGDQYCVIPDERCQDDRCVPIVGGEVYEPGGGQRGGAESSGIESSGMESSGMESSGMESSGISAGDQMSGTEGGAVAGDHIMGGDPAGGEQEMGGEFEGGSTVMTWSLEVDEWRDVMMITPSSTLTLRGVVRTEGGGVPLDAALKVSLDPISVSTEVPEPWSVEPRVIPLDVSGAFTLPLTLPRGTYRLTISAYGSIEDAGESLAPNAQREAKLRVDDFVTRRAGDLYLGEERFTYLGVSAPDLLPWIIAQPALNRASAARQVWRSLASAGVRVARVYVGWGGDELNMRDASGELDSTVMSALEIAIHEAALEGIKLILVLSAAEELDSFDAHLRVAGINDPSPSDLLRVYRNTPARSALLDWLAMLPNAESSITSAPLSDDPTILGWELTHQPRWRVGDEQLSSAELISFLELAMERLHAAAPRQLILSGEVGLDMNPTPYQPWSQQLTDQGLGGLLDGSLGGAWAQVRATIGAEHPQWITGFSLDDSALAFPPMVSWPLIGQLWIRAHTTAHIPYQRPLVIHLARARRDLISEEQQRRALTLWTREARSQGLDGFTVGDLRLAIEGGSMRPYDWPFDEPATHTLLSELAALFDGQTP